MSQACAFSVWQSPCVTESYPTYYECRACGQRFNKPSNFGDGEHSSPPVACWTVDTPAAPPPPVFLASWTGVHLDKGIVIKHLGRFCPIHVRHHVFDTDTASHNLVFSFAHHESEKMALGPDSHNMVNDAHGNMCTISVRLYK